MIWFCLALGAAYFATFIVLVHLSALERERQWWDEQRFRIEQASKKEN